MKREDKFINFLGHHSPKFVAVIILFQFIMFLKYIWYNQPYYIGFIGLCVTVESAMWYWIVKGYDN